MRRFLTFTSIILAFTALVLTPAVVLAQGTPTPAPGVLDPVCATTPQATVCTKNTSSKNQTATNNKIYGPNGILTRVARLLAIIVGVASVIVITVGGIRYTLSNGDSSQTVSARNTIIYALVGLAIALLAQSIVVFVLNKL